MRIDEYYAEKFGFDTIQQQSAQNMAASQSTSFFDTLKDCAKTPAAAQAAAETLEEQAVGEAIPLETGHVPVNVVDVEAEYGLTLSNGMSPEAIEKQTQLLERLDKLCADNPGVYYRLNPDIYQKMADSEEFEKSIYEAVDAFEKATVEALAASDRAVSAMYVNADGDYVLLTGKRPGEDMENEETLWDTIITRMREAAKTEEELQNSFAGMPDGLAKLVWQHLLDKQAEAADETAGADEAAEAAEVPEAVA